MKIPGVELRVLTTDSDGPGRIPVESTPTELPVGYKVYYCRRWFGADIAPGLFRRSYGMIKWADVVHLTAVYSPPTIPVLLLCSILGKPVVWSTRGALQRWEGSTRTTLKGIWEKLCNSLCKLGRVVLHVTSEAEQLESGKRISNARATVIPNGVELPTLNGFHEQRKDSVLHVLYLGRLHPIKGIENLLRAVAMLKGKARLSICGDGDVAYQDQLHSLARELGLNGSVKFQGKVGGAEKEQQFAAADLCVVPSFKENFCIVVAEALAREVPVVASHGTPWQRLVEKECGLWVGNSSEELSAAMNLAASLPLTEMGKRGRAWMGQEYSWPAIAQQMFREYESLIQARQSAQ